MEVSRLIIDCEEQPEKGSVCKESFEGGHQREMLHKGT